MNLNCRYSKPVLALAAAAMAIELMTAQAAFAGRAGIDEFRADIHAVGGGSVFFPSGATDGNTYGDWSTVWWQHMTSIPFDPTTNCGYGQSGPVWFLAESPSGKGAQSLSCTVPAGKAIFVPIINVECSTLEKPPFSTSPNGMPNGNFGCADEESCRRCATTYGDHIVASDLNASIDNTPVTNLTTFRAASPPFTFNAANKNVFINAVGRGTSASDGYWLLVRPLSVGTHTIRLHGSFDILNNFTEDVVYTIIVTP
ncbi:hypothetical protein J8I87_39825 [Paraburkholderia sp. LEh10]|uniref:hypothetical protein n=1 Tax=Paraburkholderia sp. LEh10 TaxID=2821353 RepID=UPI001AE13943|nr:hypothetical protein [Paraburkholderia sp. LEh10]MBP0595684.1 hypothetical protein [Paraburkholderia sp. LEh10]